MHLWKSKYLSIEILLGSEWPTQVENRLALSVVAASILGGESENVNKWECVGDIYPEKEGAPKSLREMEWYMLDYVGSVNVSADDTLCAKVKDEYEKRGKKCEDDSVFYDDTTQGMHFYTGGEDFGTNEIKFHNHYWAYTLLKYDILRQLVLNKLFFT